MMQRLLRWAREPKTYPNGSKFSPVEGAWLSFLAIIGGAAFFGVYIVFFKRPGFLSAAVCGVVSAAAWWFLVRTNDKPQ